MRDEQLHAVVAQSKFGSKHVKSANSMKPYKDPFNFPCANQEV